MRILIADSDFETIEDISAALNLCISELELSTTTSGEQCIKTVKREYPDIVILGINLSDMYCYNTILKIREISDVPIIIISYKKDGDELSKCLNLGANYYMVKPIKEIELIARIKKLLNVNKKIETQETANIRKQNIY